MIYEIDKYTEFLIKAQITPNQFYICWLLYTKDDKNVSRWVNEGLNFSRLDIERLIERGFLVNTNPRSKEFFTQDLFVSPEFAEQIIIEPDEAWQELFDAYPAHLLVNGNKVPAKTLTYTDSKGIERTYTEIIKKNKFLHARVIAAINVWKNANNGYATIKIDKFVMGKYWEDIERTEDASPRSRNY